MPVKEPDHPTEVERGVAWASLDPHPLWGPGAVFVEVPIADYAGRISTRWKAEALLMELEGFEQVVELRISPVDPGQVTRGLTASDLRDVRMLEDLNREGGTWQERHLKGMAQLLPEARTRRQSGKKLGDKYCAELARDYIKAVGLGGRRGRDGLLPRLYKIRKARGDPEMRGTKKEAIELLRHRLHTLRRRGFLLAVRDVYSLRDDPWAGPALKKVEAKNRG